MNFKDFINDGKVRKATPDRFMAESIIKNTFEDLKFLEQTKLTELSKRKLVTNYYDSLLKGYKIYSHEAFTPFLEEELKDKILSIKFDRFRKIRNGLNYYGKSIQLNEAKEIIEELKRVINEIKQKFIKK